MIHAKKVHNGKTYYYPAKASKVTALADDVHVDIHQPSRGYGGRTLQFELEDGTVDEVQGPWHTTAPKEFNFGELYLTRVELKVDGEVIYKEGAPVLGTFFRGDRIAQQLADAWNTQVQVLVESAGGSHAHTCRPGDKLHPLAQRAE